MVKNFGQRLRIEFQVLSAAVYSVPTHWIGRSVPCAGDDCPMCVLRQPRQLYFAGLRFERQSSIFELPQSLERAIEQSWVKFGGDLPAGLVVAARRAGPRDEWTVTEGQRAPLSAPKIAPAQVAAAVAELYRLEKPMLAETFVEWFERVRSGQAVVLERSVLPFGGEKSSRGSSQAARS
jgi:hypothetical protein